MEGHLGIMQYERLNISPMQKRPLDINECVPQRERRRTQPVGRWWEIVLRGFHLGEE